MLYRLSLTERLCFSVTGLLCLNSSVAAEEYFDPALVEVAAPEQPVSDLSHFNAGSQAPGIYRVDIYLNQERRESRDVTFNADDKKTGAALTPCLSRALLDSYGVNVNKFPSLQDDAKGCANIDAIPEAKTLFAFNEQRLTLSIPQQALSVRARGYIPPDRWDEGINALMLNYSYSGVNDLSGSETGGSRSDYLNLRPGLNVGPWRLRNYTTWYHDGSGQKQWDTVYTYLQRAIIPLRSVMLAGDGVSPSDVFDNVSFRGLQLASDDDMLPESVRGYAPVVRGIARTNADVVIRQNSYVIYRTSVAPGAFEITDLYPTGSSGDLNVTVQESDGSEQHFTVPFASLPVLQREGRLKYSLAGGHYRTYDSDVEDATFYQATAIYGLPWRLTLYGGVQYSPSRYRAGALGLGVNLGDAGALSGDIITAQATVKNQPQADGKAARLRYSKSIMDTGTTLALAGYRYLDDRYYTLPETLDSWTRDPDQFLPERRKNRVEATLSQQLWQDAGALTLSFVTEDYWHSTQETRSLSVSYTNNWRGINYGISYSDNRNIYSTSQDAGPAVTQNDRILFFNLNVPLDRWLRNTWANYSASIANHSGTTHSLGLNGSLLEDSNLNWSVQESRNSQDDTTSGSISTNYKGTYGETSLGYSHDSDRKRVNYALKGGIVGHRDGVTLSQVLGETTVLVKAPGASGVRVQNQPGVKTDFRGYTLVPYATPYRENTVTLDNTTWGDNVDMNLAAQTVVPTRGAVARATFATRIGQRALLTLRLPDGTPAPFGASVGLVDGASDGEGIVGEGGEAYLRGLPETGQLLASWGDGAGQRCYATFDFSGKAQHSGLVRQEALCRPGASQITGETP